MPRTTPRPDHLLDPIIELLKANRGKLVKTAAIHKHLKPILEEMGLRQRAPAVSYALLYLERGGRISHPKHGFWMME